MSEIKWLKNPIFWLAMVLILVWVGIWQFPKDEKLRIIFCDVGQGDAALITYKSLQILVDGGPDNRVLDCLQAHLPFWDKKIEMVVSTHPDTDHVTGLIDVIDRYVVTQFLINSKGKDSGTFEAFKEAVLAEEASVYFPKKGDQVNLGALKLVFLWPKEQDQVLGATTVEKKVNESSVVFSLSFGQFEALFPGDISSPTEALIDFPDVELLKIAHHGSKYSTSEQFLKESEPEMAIISVGKNSFGHPTKEVIDRLEEKKIKLLRTDQAGEIEVVSDGQSWTIN